MGYPVNTPDMVAGLAFIDEAALTNTRRKIDLATTPAKSVTFQALNLTGATAKRVYIVVNAVSDAEAAVKLATAGQRHVLQMGATLTLAFNEPVSRIDLITDVAETGTNSVVTTAIGG